LCGLKEESILNIEPVVKDINLSGVIKLNEANRIFNYDRLASQIIGYTNIDNIGLSEQSLSLTKFSQAKKDMLSCKKWA
jgi:hypothetical protein